MKIRKSTAGGFIGLSKTVSRVEKDISKMDLCVERSMSEKSNSQYLTVWSNDIKLDEDGFMIETPLVKIRFSGHDIPEQYRDSMYIHLSVRSIDDVKNVLVRVKSIFNL